MSATRRSPLLDAAATVLAPISWGTTYVVVTELLPDDRPLLVAVGRVLPASIVLLLVGRLRSSWRPVGREWGRTAALAACNFAVFFPLLFVATYRMPGGVAAAFGGLQPLLVVSLTLLVTGRRPTRSELIVGMVAAVGVALVVLRPGATFDAIGVLAGAGSALSFATGVVITRTSPPPPNQLRATGWQLLLGGVALIPLTLAVEGAPVLPSGAGGVFGVLYLSLAGTAAAYVLWFRGVRVLPVVAPPLLGLAAPVTGALMGWLVLSEDLNGLQLVGFAITIGAIAWGALTSRPSDLNAPRR